MDTAGRVMAVCFEKPKKTHNRKDFFVHTWLDGLPADGVTAMVIKECLLLLHQAVCGALVELLRRMHV